jgi:hypothetical protein
MSSYALFFSRSGTYEGATPGRVSALERVVKMKRARALDWIDAFHDDLVTENQMIYTDELSKAEVNFTSGQKLTISANSLVKIRSRGRENELDVGKGTIRATLSGNEPFIVKLNGEDYELKGKGADVEINLHGNVGEIGVVSGEVALEKDGKVTALDEKTALVIEGEKVSTRVIAYTLNFPGKEALLYTGSETYEVPFQWTGPLSGKLRLATHADFSDETSFEVSGDNLKKKLPPGDYFVKLEGDSGTSLVSEFRIVKEVPPEVLRPLNGDVIDSLVDENHHHSVRLEWEGDLAKAYQVEITEGKTTTTKDVSLESLSFSPAGDFSWRVRINDPARPDARWSQLQQIKVKLHPFPVAPTNLYPDGVEYQTFSGKPEKIELSWSSTSPTEIEYLEGNRSQQFSSEGNSLEIQPEKTGTHKWRIRAKDKFERVSAWSDWKEFTVVDLSHEKSGSGVQRIQLKRPDQEVTFGWKGTGGSYIFELSDDRDFKNIISRKEISGSETKVAVPKTGTYYWRSREYRPDGTLHVSEPKKVIIEPLPAPGKPEALPRMEIPLETQDTSASILDRLMSSAYADDVFGRVTINLPPKENIKSYVLKIFRKGEATPLVEETLSKPVFVWKNAVPGEYDFQYAVVDFFERQSPFSDISRLTVLEPAGPARPLLISPIRLEEVKDLEFHWGYSRGASSYTVTLYRDEKLQEKIAEKKTGNTDLSFEESLTSGTYYWQVVAQNKAEEKTPSSIGRFIFQAPKEEIIVQPPVMAEWKLKNRASISWAPSSDTYSFKENSQSGKIDGKALMGLEGRGTFFHEKWITSGEFLRQSGKVFKKETYSFTKITFDSGWVVKSGKHTLSVGPGIGFGMGQSYGIEDSKVKASSMSGALYGVVGRSFHQLGRTWGAEGKLSYLLGGITELEVSGNALKSVGSYYFVLGAGIVKREYSKNNGEQSSLKLNAGIGREF